MPKLFLIPGLGADERLFRRLDLSGFDVVPITWFDPDKNDSLTSYATKLIELYKIVPGSDVIGVSLGGLITIEIAKQVNLSHGIVISSIKSGGEVPWYFKASRYFPIHKLFTGKVLQAVAPIIRPVFSRFVKNGEGKLFVSMMRKTSPKFLTWATRAVLDWNGKPAPYKIHHLIGTADLVFYQGRIKDAIIIPNGEHLMVYTRAAEISPIIREILTK